LLSELGHEVIVANARKVRLIGESRKKDDRLDAQTLARLARIDPQLLYPVKHRKTIGGVVLHQRDVSDMPKSGVGVTASNFIVPVNCHRQRQLRTEHAS
jgi:hypothetical protein